VTSAGGSAVFRAWANATRRPVDTFAVLAAVAASLIVVVNAVLMQSGARTAPYFANPKPAQISAGDAPKPAVIATIPPRPGTAAAAPQLAAARHNDPIADLIGPSQRIAAVQRALSEYGYGQIKPSGVLDDATGAAIEKFEREHRLPVTGGLSDRLVSEFGAMVGHPLE
jgi:Putative peptidoglycan binding domain